jgi:hypothetical protein
VLAEALAGSHRKPPAVRLRLALDVLTLAKVMDDVDT